MKLSPFNEDPCNEHPLEIIDVDKALKETKPTNSLVFWVVTFLFLGGVVALFLWIPIVMGFLLVIYTALLLIRFLARVITNILM